MDTSAATHSEGVLLEELGWLRTLARRLLNDPNDAEDVVQEAWLKTRDVVDTFPSRGRLRAWLTGLVHRMARDTMRARRRRERREEVVAASARQDAEDGVERLAALESLLHTVRMLDEPLRAVVLLRYLDGHTTAEIAAALNISEDLVRKRLSRGRAALRRALGVSEEVGEGAGRRLVLGAGSVLLVGLALGVWAYRQRSVAPLAPTTVEVLPAAVVHPAQTFESPAVLVPEPAHDSESAPVAEAEPASAPPPSDPPAADSTAPGADAIAPGAGTLDPAASSARPAISTGPE